MKMTIKNKLLLGFTGVLLLMAAIAGIGSYAVFSLRKSAQDTTRIGDRLNSISVEIQMHNLEAQRKVKSYFLERGAMGEQKASETYLDEANFEISEIQSLASRALKLAPTDETRSKFARINASVDLYVQSMDAAVEASKGNAAGKNAQAAMASYENAAEQLHESAEDGEIAGRDAAQSFQEEIERISKRSVALVIGFSIAGLILALAVSFTLARAILVPVGHLREVAESVSMGNLNVAVHRYSNDEIGDLADSFARMVTAVKFFRMEAEEAQSAADVPEGVAQ
jgi:nitrogen fixation/metabolism regulation signal transduction histidine kinase